MLLWILGFVIGMTVTALASRQAVSSALAVSEVSNISPGLIGLTVVAIGTDLPEIANSIVAALTGHGDVAVGDAAGSAMTQVTLVLALLCFATGSVRADRQTVLLVGGLTAAALFVDAVLVQDGVLSRAEGFALVVGWFALIVLVQRRLPVKGAKREEQVDPSRTPHSRQSGLRHSLKAIGWLLIVAAAAMLVVRSFVEVTEAVGVPELFASAIVLSIGTSLPELVVDWTAIRRGAAALAIGDLFGSSLLDATLAIGIGPAVRAITVSPGAVMACVIAAVAVLAATAVGSARPVLGIRSGAALLGIYGVAAVALIVATT
jgi:cation:H+ antiporter